MDEETLRLRILEALAWWDPANLVAIGRPGDEYQPEVPEIAELVSQESDLEVMEVGIAKVLRHWLGFSASPSRELARHLVEVRDAVAAGLSVPEPPIPPAHGTLKGIERLAEAYESGRWWPGDPELAADLRSRMATAESFQALLERSRRKSLDTQGLDVQPNWAGNTGPAYRSIRSGSC